MSSRLLRKIQGGFLPKPTRTTLAANSLIAAIHMLKWSTKPHLAYLDIDSAIQLLKEAQHDES